MKTLPTTELILHLPSVAVSSVRIAVVLGLFLVLALLLAITIIAYLKNLLTSSAVVLSPEEAKLAALSESTRPGLFSHLMILGCCVLLTGFGFIGWKLFSNGDAIGSLQNATENSGHRSPLVASLLADGQLPEDMASRVKFFPKDVDTLLRQRVVFDPCNEALSSLAMTRTGLGVTQTDDAVVLLEMVRLFNRPILIQYCFPDAGGNEKSGAMVITANGLPVTGLIASYLWSGISEQLNSAFRASPLSSKLRFLGLQNGGVVFERVPVPR